MRLLNAAGLFFAIASAALLYSLNYETRRIEAEVQAQERAVQKARNDIAVLKAERSHLTRPDRIDPLARRLGLVPPSPEQFTSPSQLSDLAEQDSLATGR